LISTGDKFAIASRGRWNAEGALIWWLKNRIDRRWMRMYQDLDGMARMSAPRIGNGAMAPEMRCGGCGAKVGSELLGRVLRRLRPPSRSDVIVGLDPADDAAVVTVSGNQLLVQSVDFPRLHRRPLLVRPHRCQPLPGRSLCHGSHAATRSPSSPGLRSRCEAEADLRSC
jgi:selenide,water dikinase